MIYVRISNEGYYVSLSRKQAEIDLQQLHGILHECISSSDCLDLLQREAKSRHAHPPSKIVCCMEFYMSASHPAIASIFSNAKPKAAMHIPHPKSCWESLQAGTISLVSSGLNLSQTLSLSSRVLVRFRFGLMNNWPEPIRTPTT